MISRAAAWLPSSRLQLPPLILARARAKGTCVDAVVYVEPVGKAEGLVPRLLALAGTAVHDIPRNPLATR